jgi:hypothetical protein
MRNRLASALLVLSPVVLFNIASAIEHGVKRHVDFTATPQLNGPTSSLGKTGVVVKIQSAAIAKDGTITARATIVDSDGFPLDRLGVATHGPVSMSFIAAYIPAGQSQYVSYTTSVAAATLNSNPSQTTRIPSRPRRRPLSTPPSRTPSGSPHNATWPSSAHSMNGARRPTTSSVSFPTDRR